MPARCARRGSGWSVSCSATTGSPGGRDQPRVGAARARSCRASRSARHPPGRRSSSRRPSARKASGRAGGARRPHPPPRCRCRAAASSSRHSHSPRPSHHGSEEATMSSVPGASCSSTSQCRPGVQPNSTASRQRAAGRPGTRDERGRQAGQPEQAHAGESLAPQRLDTLAPEPRQRGRRLAGPVMTAMLCVAGAGAVPRVERRQGQGREQTGGRLTLGAVHGQVDQRREPRRAAAAAKPGGGAPCHKIVSNPSWAARQSRLATPLPVEAQDARGAAADPPCLRGLRRQFQVPVDCG